MPHLARTKICVYCGTGTGASPAHMEAARALARAMAANNIDHDRQDSGLINGPLSVHGIIPETLVKHERAGSRQAQNIPDEAVFGRTTLVRDMHTRKKLMAEEVFAGGPGSGFIGLSGGFGTMEEIFETTTWIQLGIHSRGIVLLNVDGYWNGIIDWLDKAAEEGFVKPGNKGLLAVAETGEGAINALREYKVSSSIYQLQWGAQ
ncbi:Rossmann fold nucleotide-binding protein [Fusarium phyllophilum]|uniref:Rossmann fold nucleotide-binding protein n=1 Tax=Fusarium phyllophilum TaxID=47803 RepID=A0A8H5NDH4_9HYPO|nr:Rossmann fold nucleotide-binding protein [Fusarium phyllophilum]